jgi:hypothetical protein
MYIKIIITNKLAIDITPISQELNPAVVEAEDA